MNKYQTKQKVKLDQLIMILGLQAEPSTRILLGITENLPIPL